MTNSIRIRRSLLPALAIVIVAGGTSAQVGRVETRPRLGVHQAAQDLPPAAFQLAPDRRAWTEKVSGDMVARIEQAPGLVDCIVAFREPEGLVAATATEPGHPARLKWIARTAQEVGREYTLTGGRVLMTYSHLPIIALRIPASSVPVLGADRRVEGITPNRLYHTMRTEGKKLMHVPEVQALGWTGRNIGIAIFDTGVDYTHKELSPAGTKTIKLYNAIDKNNDPMDKNGHGTSVAGIAAGSEGGVAPDATIVAVRVLDQSGNGTSDQILDGINQALANITGGNPYHIRVANFSLGGYDDKTWPPNQGTCDDLDAPTKTAFDSLVSAGVVVVVAAGNGGCTKGVAWPACISNAIAVGAVYDDKICSQPLPPPLDCLSYSLSFGKGQCNANGCSDDTQPDRVTCYTDAGDKLDVWAPSHCAKTPTLNSGYEDCFGGTSAAAPYTSGVVALLAQAVPGASAAALKDAIRNAGKPVLDQRPGSGITRNRVDAPMSLARLQSSPCIVPDPPAGLASTLTSVCSGQQFTVSWAAAPGASSYAVQVADNAQFTNALSFTSTGTSLSLYSDRATSTVLYFRVRVSLACGTASNWSPAVPVTYTAACAPGQYTRAYYVAGMAGRQPGSPPATWYADLSVLNTSASPVNLRLTFYGNTGTVSNTAQLPSHQQVSWAKVLESFFGITVADAGVIVVESSAPVAVLGRSYAMSAPGAPSYGQDYPGLELSQALTVGVVGYLPGLRRDQDFYTNIEFANVSATDAQIEVKFYSTAGALLSTEIATATANHRGTLTRKMPAAGWGFAEVRVLTPNAGVLCFGSMIDDHSKDPTTVPVWIQ